MAFEDVVSCPKCGKSYPLIFKGHHSFDKPEWASIICVKCNTTFYFQVYDIFTLDWMEDIDCLDTEYGLVPEYNPEP